MGYFLGRRALYSNFAIFHFENACDVHPSTEEGANCEYLRAAYRTFWPNHVVKYLGGYVIYVPLHWPTESKWRANSTRSMKSGYI